MRTGKIIAILLSLILMLSLGALLPTIFSVSDSAAQGVPDLPVYTDVLAAGWQNWSWSADIDFSNTTPLYSGTASTAVTYQGGSGDYGALYLHADSVDISNYDTLRFWIHGGNSGNQNIYVMLNFDDTNEYQIFATAGIWQEIEIPLSQLGWPATVSDITWQTGVAGAQPTFYLDDIAFENNGTPTPTPPPPPALSVDAADRHPISPYIYGMNFASEEVAEAVRLPVRRWGGNSTTRYNWEIDVHNTGSDWYFENIPNTPGRIDAIVQQNLDTGTETLLTMPLIGWTPKRRVESHPYDCGFRGTKYGDQEDFDYSGYEPDCGNGVSYPSGIPITGNDPTDTSKVITESFVISWINHLITEFGTADEGGVRFYDLDNEPMLWNHTHRDVYPDSLTYDEIRDRTYQYAAAIKQTDPTAQTLGPVAWGWCAYFHSAFDNCYEGNDYQNHGNTYFVPWYLQQMAEYEQTNGARILDYLDLHIYPQIDGVFLKDLGNASVQAARLRSTRQLWDPTYIHEGWIGEPVYLIPRMQQWVNNNYPGTKTAITEYNWGALGYMNGALAQADILGIFGREGLDLATLWSPPDIDDPGTFAFRMYRNYDGADSGFGETSIHAASTDQGQLSIYAAQRDSDNALTLMIINKTALPLTSAVSLANFQPGANAQVLRFSETDLTAIIQEPDQPVNNDGFTAVFPANSITLVIIPPGGGPISGVNIHGPATGVLNTTYTFTSTVSPLDASTPISYTWSPEPDSGQGTSAATYSWATIGSKTITITAENSGGNASDTHAIIITDIPVTGVTISGPATGVLSTTYTFNATVSPLDAATPISYTWSPPPLGGQGLITATYNWDTPGNKVITVTAENSEGNAIDTHTVAISAMADNEGNVYLPVMLK